MRVADTRAVEPDIQNSFCSLVSLRRKKSAQSPERSSSWALDLGQCSGVSTAAKCHELGVCILALPAQVCGGCRWRKFLSLMRVLIFGATGLTGRLVLSRCEERGYTVVTYGRRPGGGSQSLTGALDDVASLRAACKDVDAVISCLASSNADAVCSQATRSLIATDPGHLRYTIISGASVEMPSDVRTHFERILLVAIRIFLGRMLGDRQNELDMLRSSKLAWTALRPPRLTNGKGSGAWKFDGYRPSASYITREDLADAVIAALSRDDLIYQAPFVSAV